MLGMLSCGKGFAMWMQRIFAAWQTHVSYTRQSKTIKNVCAPDQCLKNRYYGTTFYFQLVLETEQHVACPP